MSSIKIIVTKKTKDSFKNQINLIHRPAMKEKGFIGGFTLVALSITIVVLLILVAVAIFYLTRKNGLLGKTSLADKLNETLYDSEMTYVINSENENIMNITVIGESGIGIDEIVTPDDNKITPTNTKNKIAVDYQINLGEEYTFKLKMNGSSEYEEYILKASADDKPEIIQSESYAYPLLTKYGVELNKSVEIDYGENTNNYYSTDNGKTWTKYEREVNITKECTLMAKSITNGKKVQRISSENITIILASNALGTAAYDGDEGTKTGRSEVG